MKNYFMKSSISLMVLSVALAGCNQEDIQQRTSEQLSDKELKLFVSTQDFVSDAQGRAITNNDATRTSAFENGDQMGLYIFSEDGDVLCDNLLYTYTDGSWTTDKTIYQYKNAQYVAYFPYCKDLSGVTGSESITTYFADNILSNVSQTNAEAYEQADLMIATTSQVDGANVNLTLAHQFSMIELNVPCRKYITTATDGFQYAAPVKMDVKINGKTDLYCATDGVYRMIVAPETVPLIEGSVEYDENMPIYFSSSSVTMNPLTAGTFTQFNVTYTDPAVEGLTKDETTGRYIRPLQPGDYYYSDGTIYPYDESKAKQPFTEGCIGVIFEVGTGAPGTKWTHGSVLALNNAHSDWSRWGNAGTPIDGNSVDASSGSVELFNFLSGKMDGYTLTNTFTTAFGVLDCAFTKIKVFGSAEAPESWRFTEYAAPENQTSGWYMPSAGQLMAIWNGLGGYTVTADNYMNNVTSDHSTKSEAVKKIQAAIEKVDGIFISKSNSDTEKGVKQLWWSTTEVNNNDNVWAIEWNYADSANEGWTTGFSSKGKTSGWDIAKAYARPVLSF